MPPRWVRLNDRDKRLSGGPDRFDPEKEVTAGQPEPITRSSSETVYPAVSTDGQWLAH
jgi:hypothetical protein